MRQTMTLKSATCAALLLAGIGAASLVIRADGAVTAAGLGHRDKASAYSTEKDGIFLGVDASQASWRAGNSEKYVPIAVCLANSGKTGLWVNDDSFTYRAGETGVWQNLPKYKEVMGNVVASSTMRRQLGETSPYALRFSAMRRVLYSPFPSNDPDLRRGQSRIRVEEAWITGQSYVYAVLYLPNPGANTAGTMHYLRYQYPKEKIEITTGFHIGEAN